MKADYPAVTLVLRCFLCNKGLIARPMASYRAGHSAGSQDRPLGLPIQPALQILEQVRRVGVVGHPLKFGMLYPVEVAWIRVRCLVPIVSFPNTVIGRSSVEHCKDVRDSTLPLAVQ
jgi:hypothetical protein